MLVGYMSKMIVHLHLQNVYLDADENDVSKVSYKGFTYYNYKCKT